jgi:Na+-translocating ferredoxin:NAD+ oxidoreductase RnfG subunit
MNRIAFISIVVCMGALVSAKSGTGDPVPIPKNIHRLLQREFPDARFSKENHFLTEEQRERVDELTGQLPPSDLVVSYQVVEDSELKATVYFDTHKVRTASETLLVAVSPAGKVYKVKTIAFGEPREYLPRENWFDQFRHQKLSSGLALKQDIHAVTGATITARKTVEAVRRSLALHKILFEAPAG